MPKLKTTDTKVWGGCYDSVFKNTVKNFITYKLSNNERTKEQVIPSDLKIIFSIPIPCPAQSEEYALHCSYNHCIFSRR